MIASAILLAPMGLVSLVNDCRYEASLAPVEGTLVAKLTHSPDDRFAAVELVPSLDISNDPARLLRRVAVVDLNGERAPKLFEPRFAHIGGWSEDGRYLAIQDRTLGRLHLEHDDVDFSSYWSALKSDLAQLPLRTLVYDTQTGTVQTLSVRVIRNGWRTPEDLLHIGATLGGDCALTLGTQGIEATLSRRRVRVPYTRDGKPVVRGERGEVFGWGADGLEPIEPIDPERTKQLARDRKKAKRLLGGWERKFTPFEPSSDALETASKKRRSRKTLTLTRGDQVVVLEPVYRAFDLKGVSDVVMIIDADGLKRVSLPDGDSSLVFASTGWIKFQSSPNVRKSRLAYDGAQWHRLDMQTGSSTPIDLGGLKGPTLLLGGRVIGTRGGGRYWIRDADGSTRSIFAPPALAAK
jgi:hypothetical protein